MQLASLLFVTTTMVAPAAAPDSHKAPAIRPVAEATSGVLAQSSSSRAGSSSRRNRRRFGVGGNLNAGTRGVGANLRYWLSDQVGVTLQASWNRPDNYGGRNNVNSNQQSTLLVAPSFQYMFTPHDATKDINLRPYAGGGINYARASVPQNAPLQQTRNSRGVGGQVFGGVELTFAEAEAIAISGEVIHYWVPSNFFNASALSGTQFVGAVYLYF